MDQGAAGQDERYRQAAADYAGALDRLARGYEADADLRRDLLQDIHAALWRSFAGFDGRCSMRTWVYRVAHNVGAGHVARRRRNAGLVGLDELAELSDLDDPEKTAADSHALRRLMALIHDLQATDRQLMLLYLEGLDAAAMGEIAGLTPGAVAVKVHRIKAVLAKRFDQGGRDGV